MVAARSSIARSSCTLLTFAFLLLVAVQATLGLVTLTSTPYGGKFMLNAVASNSTRSR